MPKSVLLQEIKTLRKDVEYIKEHMIDIDSILTEKERKQHEKSLKELKEGKTISLEKLKKELGI